MSSTPRHRLLSGDVSQPKFVCDGFQMQHYYQTLKVILSTEVLVPMMIHMLTKLICCLLIVISTKMIAPVLQVHLQILHIVYLLVIWKHLYLVTGFSIEIVLLCSRKWITICNMKLLNNALETDQQMVVSRNLYVDHKGTPCQKISQHI